MLRTLSRRLERLKAISEIQEEDAVKVQIVYVDGDGTETPGAVFYCRDEGSRPRRRHRRITLQEAASAPAGTR